VGVSLLIITNGRQEYIQQTIASLESVVNYVFDRQIIVDDSMDSGYHEWLRNHYGDYEVHPNASKAGLSGSIAHGWSLLGSDSDFVFHLEEDFTFNHHVDIDLMRKILESNAQISQVALVRQPLNSSEIASGGVLKQYVGQFVDHTIDSPSGQHRWLEHQILFTLNPCLYPKWVMDMGWMSGWGEREFTDHLLSADKRFAYLGDIDVSPQVHHIGHHRATGWQL